MAIIEIEGLSFAYPQKGRLALDNVSLKRQFCAYLRSERQRQNNSFAYAENSPCAARY